ncbi:MAG: HAD-IA family hydrolase [Actinomycetota bacterium]|nr:HAD-IA family hydrolase [Actinomycetota bacterium]
MCRALLFDLDGTISETDSIHHPSWAEMLAPRGYDVDWPFYEENISGRLNPEIVSEFMPDVSEEEGRRLIEEKEVDFRSRVYTLTATPGLRELIGRGRNAAMCIALVTNAPKLNAIAVINALGLEGDFDPITLAEDAGAGKPDPAPYLMALEYLDIPPTDAVAFEDSTSGIKSAASAGIPTVGVASTHDPETLSEAGAFAVFRDFTDPGLASMLFG